MRRAAAVAGLIAASCTVITAVIVRLTIADRFRVTGWIFYSTPWLVIACAAALLAMAWRGFGQIKIAIPMALLAAIAAALWLLTSWQWRSVSPRRGELRVVLWNVSRPEQRLPEVTAWLRAQDADLLAIAEAQPRKVSTLAHWREAFPEYRVEASLSGMLCLVRGEIASLESVKAPGYFRTTVQARIRGKAVRLEQVDFNAHALTTRKIPLRHLTAHLQDSHDENVIVAGDFNTPRESVHFAGLRRWFANAFETAGSGLADTWPMPVPVLSLDQIWASQRLTVVRCQQFGFRLSDHRAVVADFDFLPPSPPPARAGF